MRYLPCRAHFIAEAAQHGGVRDSRGWQEFERYGLPEEQILGAVDLAHATSAYGVNDAVALGQMSPWVEAHLGSRTRLGDRRLTLQNCLFGRSEDRFGEP